MKMNRSIAAVVACAAVGSVWATSATAATNYCKTTMAARYYNALADYKNDLRKNNLTYNEARRTLSWMNSRFSLTNRQVRAMPRACRNLGWGQMRKAQRNYEISLRYWGKCFVDCSRAEERRFYRYERNGNWNVTQLDRQRDNRGWFLYPYQR